MQDRNREILGRTFMNSVLGRGRAQKWPPGLVSEVVGAAGVSSLQHWGTDSSANPSTKEEGPATSL